MTIDWMGAVACLIGYYYFPLIKGYALYAVGCVCYIVYAAQLVPVGWGLIFVECAFLALTARSIRQVLS